MRKEWRIYTFLGVMFVLYVVISYYKPQPLNWVPSFHPSDKGPYGCFILFDRMDDLFGGEVQTGDQTLYELQDAPGNLLIIATQGNLMDTDINALLQRVSEGDEALLAAEQFSSLAKDTLQFETGTSQLRQLPNATDTVDIRMGTAAGQLSDVLAQAYFQLPDSTEWKTLAMTDAPILIERKVGSGSLILSSTPLAFTNFAMLQDHRLAEYALTHLSDRPLLYTHFYQTGKMSSSSPFRYILTQASLTWALYLSMAVIATLIFFDSQRRQRMVQVITPPQNSTVQFVRTIGALFYRERNNYKIATKLTSYFQEELYKKYHKSPAFTERYYEWLANKSGVPKTKVIQTFLNIQSLSQATSLNDKELTELNDQMRSFDL